MNSKRLGVIRTDKQKNKQDLDKFVCREIYACQTALIDEVLKKQIFMIDDIDNLYREFDGKLLSPNICVKCNIAYRVLDSETGECESCFEENQMPQEIFEWWLVSAWLGKKLQISGEPVIDNCFGVWWGRTTTGQNIAMDCVIRTIYDQFINR
jgi:hypothetical protein